ncbi:WXG100 family type VII secretion target [Streptomyces sp. FB2]|uniref:WXG100 family type VII secretion target n=1 Tax=Streptomyces sp. FB2 TaxID=2902454 RepID=UPI0035AC09BF
MPKRSPSGVEVVRQGGRPEELEAAAKAWRQLKSEVEGMVKALDKDVRATVGHTWRGEAADALWPIGMISRLLCAAPPSISMRQPTVSMTPRSAFARSTRRSRASMWRSGSPSECPSVCPSSPWVSLPQSAQLV